MNAKIHSVDLSMSLEEQNLMVKMIEEYLADGKVFDGSIETKLLMDVLHQIKTNAITILVNNYCLKQMVEAARKYFVKTQDKEAKAMLTDLCVHEDWTR